MCRIIHLYYMCETCITGVLDMHFRCMNYMYNTPKNSTHVLYVYHTCNTHVAHLVVYTPDANPRRLALKFPLARGA